jgi:thymidylate synthase
MTKFDQIYQNLLADIKKRGVTEISERTKRETRSLPGVHFQIDLEKDGFPLLTLRKIPVKIFIAEQIWFISGARKTTDFLQNFTKIWNDFANPEEVVTVAYGYRWRKHFGRDQLKLLLQLLKNEPTSRQGVVVAWDPSQDGLSLVKKKNIPCPYTFTVNLIGGRLHLHNIVRSNDVILGLPTDVAGFALLAQILAQKLGVRPGLYSHSISNAHIYDTHYFAAEEMLRRRNRHRPIKLTLPKNAFERAEKKDERLVEEIAANLKKQYRPLEAIQGIKIVL